MFYLTADATSASDFLVFDKRDCDQNDIAKLVLGLEDCLEHCLSNASCAGVAYVSFLPLCYEKSVCMPRAPGNNLYIIDSCELTLHLHMFFFCFLLT